MVTGNGGGGLCPQAITSIPGEGQFPFLWATPVGHRGVPLIATTCVEGALKNTFFFLMVI